MKKHFLTLAALCSGLAAIAMDRVKLPDAATLKARLYEAQFDHFVEKTQIDEHLANRNITPLGVVNAVNVHLHGYNKQEQESGIDILMNMRKSDLIKVLLAEYPAAIEQLKSKGALGDDLVWRH